MTTRNNKKGTRKAKHSFGNTEIRKRPLSNKRKNNNKSEVTAIGPSGGYKAERRVQGSKSLDEGESEREGGGIKRSNPSVRSRPDRFSASKK